MLLVDVKIKDLLQYNYLQDNYIEFLMRDNVILNLQSEEHLTANSVATIHWKRANIQRLRGFLNKFFMHFQ